MSKLLFHILLLINACSAMAYAQLVHPGAFHLLIGNPSGGYPSITSATNIFRFDANLGITTSGLNVCSWQDQTTNGWILTNSDSSYWPTNAVGVILTTNNVVQFAGSHKLMIGHISDALFTNSQPITIFSVVRLTNYVEQAHMPWEDGFAMVWDASTEPPRQYYGLSEYSGQAYHTLTLLGNRISVLNTTNVFVLTECYVHATAGYIKTNDVLAASGAVNPNGMAGLVVGGAYHANYDSCCDIAFITGYFGTLSAADHSALVAYFMNRYGL